MEKKNNCIRLTESELNALVKSAVMQIISEGRFKDIAKKVGKGIGKAALYGALGAGALHAIDQGAEKQYQYQQELSRQGRELQGPTEDDVIRWMSDHEMQDTPQNRQTAIDAMSESIQTRRLSQIIRESISKVL